MSRLPEEIIEENILTRLPVKSISRFRCVSKSWNRLFRNPSFIRNHLNHAIQMNKFNILVTNLTSTLMEVYGDIDDVQDAQDIDVELEDIVGVPLTESCLYSVDNNVLTSTSSSSPFVGHALEIDYPFMSREYVPDIHGSSNGLVCIEPCDGNICIWNPATREYTRLPKPSADSDDFFVAHGFGFDCKNDDYKVLAIGDFGFGNPNSLYSLASNSWKNLAFVPYDFSESKCTGLLHNGVLHWIAATRLGSKVIVCFDISDETFHEVPLPNNHSLEDEEPFMLYLGIWEGKLCILRTNHTEDLAICTHQNDHVDVWIMMDDKWSKHLKISAQITDMSYRRPIQTLQNGEILFEGGPRGEVGIGLMLYNPNLERTTALKIHGFPDVSEVETYIETLVALNTGTYVEHNK